MKKIPDGCIEIPLEEVDYIYQPPQSHTPIIVMRQKLSPMQPEEKKCEYCGKIKKEERSKLLNKRKMTKFKRTYTMEEFEKEVLYLIRENDGNGIHSLFDKDFMGSCPCASGKLRIEGVEYDIKTHCWKSGISKNGGCTFEVKAKNNKNKQKVISLLKEALDATNWYGEYTLLEDVDKEEKELSCMKCGSKKNLNTNKDKSFVECDECMWGNDKSEKQEEWREKIKQMVLTDCFKDQPDIQRYIDFIEQLLSESKEKAKIEVLEKVLEKKTNYEMEREEHGYRVTLEYVLADDIKKEIKLLKEKE